MKKLLALVLSLIMIMSFAACSSGSENTTTTKPADTTTTTAAPSIEATEYKGDLSVPEFAITVNGKAMTQADFASLTVYECNSISINSSGTETECTYIGYKIADVLKTAGVEGATTAKITASDGYAVDFDAKLFTGANTLVAFYKDEEPSSEDKTVWIAPCDDGTSSNYAKMVVSIEAK